MVHAPSLYDFWIRSGGGGPEIVTFDLKTRAQQWIIVGRLYTSYKKWIPKYSVQIHFKLWNCHNVFRLISYLQVERTSCESVIQVSTKLCKNWHFWYRLSDIAFNVTEQTKPLYHTLYINPLHARLCHEIIPNTVKFSMFLFSAFTYVLCAVHHFYCRMRMRYNGIRLGEHSSTSISPSHDCHCVGR